MIIRFLATSLPLLLCLSVMTPRPAQAATVRQQFNTSVAELQKSPGDQKLREKIIKLALKLKPKPAVPEEAERRMARGRAAVESAEDQEGFREAVKEFEKAALAAPWLAQAYYNLGVVQDKAGDYAAAKNSLKLYLLAAPGARNAKKVKSLIYKIEYRMEKAGTRAKKEAAKPDFSGVWCYAVDVNNTIRCVDADNATTKRFLIDGQKLTITTSLKGNTFIFGEGSLEGRNFEVSSPGGPGFHESTTAPMRAKGSLSEDNTTITFSTILAPELAGSTALRRTAKHFTDRFGTPSWSSPRTWVRYEE